MKSFRAEHKNFLDYMHKDVFLCCSLSADTKQKAYLWHILLDHGWSQESPSPQCSWAVCEHLRDDHWSDSPYWCQQLLPRTWKYNSSQTPLTRLSRMISVIGQELFSITKMFKNIIFESSEVCFDSDF